MAIQTQGVPSTPSSSVWTTWLYYERRQVASFSNGVKTAITPSGFIP